MRWKEISVSEDQGTWLMTKKVKLFLALVVIIVSLVALLTLTSGKVVSNSSPVASSGQTSTAEVTQMSTFQDGYHSIFDG